MKKTTYQLETLACPSCSAKINTVLKRTPGVIESDVLFNSARVKLTYDETVVDSDTIKKQIRKLGYAVLGEKQG